MKRYSNLVADVSGVVKAGPGKIRGFMVHNTNNAVLYFQLFNKATAPTSTTEVPIFQVGLPTGTSIVVGSEFFGRDGFAVDTGIAWGTSSTATVYTANGTAKFSVQVLYS